MNELLSVRKVLPLTTDNAFIISKSAELLLRLSFHFLIEDVYTKPMFLSNCCTINPFITYH